MKRLLMLLTLCMLATPAFSQFTVSNLTSPYRQLFDKPWGKWVTATDTARDTAIYYHGVNQNMGGSLLHYGLEITDSMGTAGTYAPNLVLGWSADSLTWNEVDSVVISAPETEVVYHGNYDATYVMAPYWRLRFCGGSATLDTLLGSGASGGFHLFFLVEPK